VHMLRCIDRLLWGVSDVMGESRGWETSNQTEKLKPRGLVLLVVTGSAMLHSFSQKLGVCPPLIATSILFIAGSTPVHLVSLCSQYKSFIEPGLRARVDLVMLTEENIQPLAVTV
jgi:hypothetical protein